MFDPPIIYTTMSYLTPEYLSEERKPKQLDLAIAFCVLSTTTVILRVVSRKLIRAKIQWDDFLVLFAVVLNGGLLGANYSCMGILPRPFEVVQI